MRAAAHRARQLGYEVQLREPAVIGEARIAASEWLGWLGDAAQHPGPLCLISSGETTVHVSGTGRGGRNQEFALALVDGLARYTEGQSARSRQVAVASVGTDGVDGPTDAAGAIARESTMARARAAGLAPPAEFLAANDAWHFFDPLGDLVRSGPTGTNVGDVQIGLIR
jgi:glycerate 2-kinase